MMIQIWRQRAGFTCSQIDKLLGFEMGLTKVYEKKALGQVPARDLVKLARLCHVSDSELAKAIEQASLVIKSKKT